MEKDSKYFPMDLSLKDSLLMGTRMVMEEVLRQEGKFIKAFSHLIRWTGKGSSNGLMVGCTKETGRWVKNVDMECFIGLMDKFIRVSSKTTNVMVKECSITQTAKDLKAFGKMARRMVNLFTSGQTVRNIMCSTLMGRNKEKECLRTQRFHSKSLRTLTNL